MERQYKLFIKDNRVGLYNKSINDGQIDRQYEISILLVLYHLVRGNLCLRISQYYYENYELDTSDNWASKGIEIFWHGKNQAAALRDSAKSDKRIQADLYLRLIKLNLAKYYRDYARKNRRSDFDAALDEFRQVRYRMEQEYAHISNPEQKRQYVLIWMDAIINIAKIHRRKVSAKYSCGFPNTLVSSIIVGERYLDYFTTTTEDRLWQLLAKPVFRWRNRSGLSMNAAKAA